jgi:hypothetical protein
LLLDWKEKKRHELALEYDDSDDNVGTPTCRKRSRKEERERMKMQLQMNKRRNHIQQKMLIYIGLKKLSLNRTEMLNQRTHIKYL